MKNLLMVLLVCFSAQTLAFEFEYKLLILDIPDDKIAGAGIANLPGDSIVLYGKDWNWGMSFSDTQFEKDCTATEAKLRGFSCARESRIEMLSKICREKNLAATLFFELQEGGTVKRQEYENYVLFAALGPDKNAVALLVERRTGRTFDIRGNFDESHLKWLRLKPVFDPVIFKCS